MEVQKREFLLCSDENLEIYFVWNEEKGWRLKMTSIPREGAMKYKREWQLDEKRVGELADFIKHISQSKT